MPTDQHFGDSNVPSDGFARRATHSSSSKLTSNLRAGAARSIEIDDDASEMRLKLAGRCARPQQDAGLCPESVRNPSDTGGRILSRKRGSSAAQDGEL